MLNNTPTINGAYKLPMLLNFVGKAIIFASKRLQKRNVTLLIIEKNINVELRYYLIGGFL